MSKERNTVTKTEEARRNQLLPRSMQDPVEVKTASEVEVMSLEIEDDFDAGSDPYNRTGSFVVIEIPEDD